MGIWYYMIVIVEKYIVYLILDPTSPNLFRLNFHEYWSSKISEKFPLKFIMSRYTKTKQIFLITHTLGNHFRSRGFSLVVLYGQQWGFCIIKHFKLSSWQLKSSSTPRCFLSFLRLCPLVDFNIFLRWQLYMIVFLSEKMLGYKLKTCSLSISCWQDTFIIRMLQRIGVWTLDRITLIFVWSMIHYLVFAKVTKIK